MPPKPKSFQSYFTTKPATSTWPLHTAFKKPLNVQQEVDKLFRFRQSTELEPNCPFCCFGAKLSGRQIFCSVIMVQNCQFLTLGVKLSAFNSWCQIVQCQIVQDQIVQY